jgi:hypothetical protein
MAKWILGIIVALTLMLSALVAPIDRTPLEEQPFYSRMMSKLDSIQFDSLKPGRLKSAWAKVNITPDHAMPMAGYNPRDHFDTIHDSLFARIILLESPSQTIALINADLLIFPPVLKQRLNELVSASRSSVDLYISATHTHNSIGGWDDSTVGHLAFGDYDPVWVEQTAQGIFKAITSLKPIPSSIRYWESDAGDLVVNRIAYNKGVRDGKLRGFTLTREDSLKSCLFTYSAHATTISKRVLSLSADYPSSVISHLEKEFDFGMYMAGMVGSHSFKGFPDKDFDLLEKEGDLLWDKISLKTESPVSDSITLSFKNIPIEFGPSQLRIAQQWKVRDWVLKSLLNELKGDITYLQIGDIIMIGMPCDFSGEILVKEGLESLANKEGKHLIITSFNGDYVGYITDDSHYDSIKNAETREMNWVGPYFGSYFSEMVKKLIEKSP